MLQPGQPLLCSCGATLRDELIVWAHGAAGHRAIESMGCGRKLGPFDCCSVVEGDCLELMKQLPDGCVDAVITDPPYGNGEASRYGRTQLGLRSIAGDLTADAYLAALPMLYRVTRTNSMGAIFTGWRAFGECQTGIAAAGFSLKQVVVWDKAAPSLGEGIRDQHEFIAIVRKGMAVERQSRGNVWPICRIVGERPEHPCEKPLDVLLEIFAALPEAETILDPFLGSGTTAVAAKKLGRHFLGFEISPEYCEIARKRIAAVEAQPSLFQPKPEQMELGK